MRPPFVRDPNLPPRPPRNLRELERQRKYKQSGEEPESLFDRVLYACLNSLMYAAGGFVLDGSITVIRSLMNMGDGSIFWLFTPFLAVIGALVGFFDGKRAGADSMNMLSLTDDPYADDNVFGNAILRGIGYGIVFFFVLWLVMMLTV